MEAKLYEPPEDDGIEITQAMLDAGVSRSMDFEEEYRDSEECIAEVYRAMRHAKLRTIPNTETLYMAKKRKGGRGC